MAAGLPSAEVIVVALLYGIGAHGIMTLNDFKALKGDLQTGVRSLPVTLGPRRAAQLACVIMILPQIAVAALMAIWGAPGTAAIIAGLLALQVLAMRKMLRDPEGLAPWYNGTGVTLYVAGMMVAAVGLRGMGGI
jgi:chlorophyll synthase